MIWLSEHNQPPGLSIISHQAGGILLRLWRPASKSFCFCAALCKLADVSAGEAASPNSGKWAGSRNKGAAVLVGGCCKLLWSRGVQFHLLLDGIGMLVRVCPCIK